MRHTVRTESGSIAEVSHLAYFCRSAKYDMSNKMTQFSSYAAALSTKFRALGGKLRLGMQYIPRAVDLRGTNSSTFSLTSTIVFWRSKCRKINEECSSCLCLENASERSGPSEKVAEELPVTVIKWRATDTCSEIRYYDVC